ncbi:hypothetical protein [Anaeromyxobacter oryzae]|uniref:F5/8 type C domain-containing protein n=1 Tax=Anaeromyxobacter oryzae TaxID=2918170 RepID=A0ABM7X0D9_9BACT|nr:hypothetical protein [Anaeromyxobacter oryzae]BDG05243.1 hypothetical protein AMOR_42390 [Anaeromyxobacter oryzae]
MAAIVAAIALLGGAARAAEAFGATLEPGYTHVETDVTGERGPSTHESSDVLSQKYRLSYDAAITDHLDASAGLTLLDDRGWTRTDGISSDTHSRTSTYFGRLTLGTQVLNAGVGADRREQSTTGTTTGDFVTESYTGYATWRPLELPELDLRASHMNTFDKSHLAQDTTTDGAFFSARYNTPRSDLRYLLSWVRTTDHLRDSRTTAVEQAALGSRTDTLFAGHTSTYVSARVQSRNTLTESGGAGATVARQQLPVAGLSGIETFPATTENIVLAANPLLIDGNTTATAGVNVGYAPALAGDRDLRDVGARFGDETTSVNTLYVWFDRQLAADVGRTLAAGVQVYQSIDNERWTAVALAKPAEPSPFENRLEITIPETQARFLKVVLRPLAVGVTTDVAFRDVFITELQTLLVLPAALVPRHQSALVVAATAFARTSILRSPDFAHDLSVDVSHDSDNPRTRYSLVNGLTLGQKLTAWLVGRARAQRQDQDAGRGHEGSWEWSAALIGNPLPTAYWTLTYSGKAAEQLTSQVSAPGAPATTVRLTTISHSLSALGRADWYDGISTQANATGSIATQGDRTAQSFQASGTTSLTPNTVVTGSIGGLYSRSLTSSPETGDVLTQFARVDASLSVTPAPALSGAGTVSRVLLGAKLTTLGTLQLNYSPLRGDVQLGVAYSSTLDTAAGTRTQIFTPSLRWNLRRNVSLTSSYTWLRNVVPVQTLVSRALSATLLVTL